MRSVLQQDVRGRRVIELGCGPGVPGMLLARCGADVVLSDTEDLQRLIERNARRNMTGEDALSIDGEDDGRGSVCVHPLRWSRQAAKELKDKMANDQLEWIPRQPAADAGGGFDMILSCDCVYEPLYGDSWRDLSEAIDELAGPLTEVWIAVERRNNDGVDNFIARLEEGFAVDRVCVEAAEGHASGDTAVAAGADECTLSSCGESDSAVVLLKAKKREAGRRG